MHFFQLEKKNERPANTVSELVDLQMNCLATQNSRASNDHAMLLLKLLEVDRMSGVCVKMTPGSRHVTTLTPIVCHVDRIVTRSTT